MGSVHLITRIRKRCSIITDLDQAFFDITPNPLDSPAESARKSKATGSQQSGIERQSDLEAFIEKNPWINTFYAQHTFEVDFAAYGNHEAIVKTVPNIYKKQTKIEEAISELRSADLSKIGRRTLTMAKQEGKGWFAILLAEHINEFVKVPPYILEAIKFSHGPFPPNLIARIIQHRAEPYDWQGCNKPRFMHILDQYKKGKTDLDTLKAEVLCTLPKDSINSFLADMK